MIWEVCYWGGIEWYCIASFDSYEKAICLRDNCIWNTQDRRLHWKVIGKQQ